MLDVLTGFGIVGAVIGLGFILGKTGSVTQGQASVLSRVAVTVGTPALMFSTIAHTDVRIIFSDSLAVTALSVLIVAVLAAAVCAIFRWDLRRSIFVVLCSTYVNSGNLGIPVATYVLGDASLIAPVLLLQQLAMLPAALATLDLVNPSGAAGFGRRLLIALSNPVIIASLSGLAITSTGLQLPATFYAPFELIGQLAVPGVLLAYGVSLTASTLDLRGGNAGPALTSFALKAFALPAAAWLLGAFVFHLDDVVLFAVVVTSALPAAQNLFAYADRYRIAPTMVRDSITLSTISSAPIIAGIAILLS